MEIKCRQIQWLGHIPKMDQGHIRCDGRLTNTTWSQTVMTELGKVKLTLGLAQHAAQNGVKWREVVVALCPTAS